MKDLKLSISGEKKKIVSVNAQPKPTMTKVCYNFTGKPACR